MKSVLERRKHRTQQSRRDTPSFDEDALYPAIMSLVDDEPFSTGAKVLNQQPRSGIRSNANNRQLAPVANRTKLIAKEGAAC